LRVLITPDWYPWPEDPVSGVFCKEQAHAVAATDDVTVLAWRPERGLRAPFQIGVGHEDGLRTIRLRHANTRVPRSGFACKVAGLLAIVARLRRAHWRPDVVHAHEYTAAPVAFLLGAMTRAPVIFSEHYSGFALGALDGGEMRRARWAFEHAQMVCPVSASLARHIQVLTPGAAVEPVPNSVDTDVFVPNPVRRVARPPRLITVGSLKEVKGHRHLIEALAELRQRHQPLHLDVIGDGPLRSELEALAIRLAVDDLIAFHGAKAKGEVATALQQADVFVLPSLWETLSCALLEALSAGLPVVATNVGGIPEFVTEREGRLVTPGSAGALAAGILEVAESLERYDPHQLRATATARFSRQAVARQWAEVYASVADGSTGRR
jgi:glycosyltransferase involved in cell wall biosynthesis